MSSCTPPNSPGWRGEGRGGETEFGLTLIETRDVSV